MLATALDLVADTWESELVFSVGGRRATVEMPRQRASGTCPSSNFALTMAHALRWTESSLPSTLGIPLSPKIDVLNLSFQHATLREVSWSTSGQILSCGQHLAMTTCFFKLGQLSQQLPLIRRAYFHTPYRLFTTPSKPNPSIYGTAPTNKVWPR